MRGLERSSLSRGMLFWFATAAALTGCQSTVANKARAGGSTMQQQQIEAARQLGIQDFLGQCTDQPCPGNDRVIPDWGARYDEDGLTAFGNVRPKSNTDAIGLVVLAFTSPDYDGSGQGRYYSGDWASVFDASTTATGAARGFILQSQQFTEADRGKTVAVHLQGLVNTEIFSFEKTVVIPAVE